MSCQCKVALTLNKLECMQAAIARRDAVLQRLGAAMGGGRDGNPGLHLVHPDVRGERHVLSRQSFPHPE